MDFTKIALIRKRILLIALLGVLTTSLVASLSTIIPFYYSARNSLEQITLSNVQRQASLVNNLFEKYQDVAIQFTSRSEIRLRLEKYVAGEMSREALTAYSAPRLKDAMRLSDELLGLTRLGVEDEILVNLGKTLTGKELASYLAEPAGGSDSSLIVVEQEPVIGVKANIYSKSGKVIGQDLLYFSQNKLKETLTDKRDINIEAKVYLVNLTTKTRLDYDESSERLEFKQLRSPLKVAHLNKAVSCDQITIKPTGKCTNIFFLVPLKNTNWSLVAEIPTQSFYLPIQAQLIWPLLAIVSMLLVVIYAISRGLHPLTQRLAYQAKELEKSTEELRLVASVFEGTREAIAVTDADMRLIKVNSAFSQITGFQSDEALDKDLQSFFYQKKAIEKLYLKIKQSLEVKESWQGEIWYQCKDGEQLPVLQSISTLLDDQGQVINYIHIFNDISESKAQEERVNYLAHYDQLTDLPNRTLINRRIKKAVEKARINNQGLAILFMDLDHFKEVNDTLGHPVGDLLLKAVAQRLKGKLREQDTLGRLGGDEFLAILDHSANTEASGAVAKKIIHSLVQPFELEGNQIQIGVSVGIAIYPKDGHTADELIKNADIAMYRAKDAGRNTHRYFSSAEDG
ncbi:sensor domain-containing diguanylate cyclase [Marinospirillum insulare]|uniref:PAS domain S-box-containing protein/diguanylate cyclase (GGDEF) domain-containing protein n=1 Tax=Marinospirillum insulare TaxID=217169 RepID=A0ABQ6A0K7_9GAMM|nr:sensor domain-containing diguanylate cyclase [Marinospirillum insulare]GLR65192.1 hypothetical protein GCM10007878_26310 [Marinospirillum insulare]